MSDGRPARRAAMAPANATGETTLACAWTTLNPSSRITRSRAVTTPGEYANPPPGASGVRTRCTGTPSTTSLPRVVVTIRASTPPSRSEIARSRRCRPMPPCRGRNQSQVRATRTRSRLERHVNAELPGRVGATEALERVVRGALGHEAQGHRRPGLVLDEEVHAQ